MNKNLMAYLIDECTKRRQELLAHRKATNAKPNRGDEEYRWTARELRAVDKLVKAAEYYWDIL